MLKPVRFTYQEVTEDSDIVTADNVIQVGFVNYSTGATTIVLINGFPLYPVPLVAANLGTVASNILWFPINEGECDRTTYRIKFLGNPVNKRALGVLFKHTC